MNSPASNTDILPAVAVIIPCHNEAATIGTVVRDFRQALPWATVFVYDNNSIDETAALAEAAGAVVRSEPRQGKGHVVRRMLAITCWSMGMPPTTRSRRRAC